MSSYYENLLNRNVARYTKTTATNAFGEDVSTMSYAESGVKCRLVPVTAEQRMTALGDFKDIVYTGYFLSSQTLDHDDQIKYGGYSYVVREVSDDSSGYVRKALLSRL